MNNILSGAAVGFALVWTVTATAVVGSAVLARNASDVLERTLVVYSDDLMHASEAQMAAERIVAIGRRYLLTREAQGLARTRDAERELDLALQSLDRADTQPAERQLLEAVKRAATEYRRLLDSAFESTRLGANQQELAEALHARLLPAREQLDDKLERLVAHKQALQVAARQRASALADRYVGVTIGLGTLALLLSGVLAAVFTSRLAQISRREKASALQATQALKARDELLGIVAHDLRSPLTAITLRSAAIARGGGSEETIRSAAAIQSICGRMARLIESLLEAARIEAGRFPVAPQEVRVDALFKNALETFVPQANEHSIRLHSDVTPPDLTVWADRERLFQVLSNLIGNALKFTPQGGDVSVHACQGAGHVTFEVTDTGVGIARGELARVFERYWKADVASGRGAGLGLYIAKGIVETHKGRIWVESSPGIGSTFRFEIPSPPTRAGSRQAAPLGPPAALPQRGFRIRDRHVHR